MERPSLVGIPDHKPFPRWRLVPLLMVLVTLGVICTLMFRKDPPSVPWAGGFIFLHWTTPWLVVLVAFTWTYHRWGLARSRPSPGVRGGRWPAPGHEPRHLDRRPASHSAPHNPVHTRALPRDLAGTRRIHHLIAQNPRSKRTRPEPIREIKPGILLVVLGRLSQKDFQKALPRLVDAKGLIFDHRGYPSHEEFLKHFRPGPLEGIQMHIPVSLLPNGAGRTYLSRRWVTKSEGPTYRGRVAVLMGGDQNISSAETFLEVVAANHLAPLVGRPTAGTNGDIQEFTLPGNFVAIITGLRVLKADGSQHHGIGILPTHPVKHTREALAAGRDEDVERALVLIETGS